MTPQTLQVDFDFEARDLEINVWYAFWDSTRSWLAERGYTLYELGHNLDSEYPEDIIGYVPKIPTDGTIEYPFAFFGGDIPGLSVPPLTAYSDGRVAYAQDAQNRHVALKLMKGSSSEYQIAQYLRKESSLLSLENFNGIVPPLDFLDSGDHKIVVMPRWGSAACFPWFSTIREVLDLMLYMLKGLDYLHKNNIIHRDISFNNCLVNHFSSYAHDANNDVRRQLRREGRLVYGLMDFDLSIMFPSDATPTERRLPSNLSSDGGWDKPYDTRQGELDYDPFAFDVGCLGALFCHMFQHLTETVPMLAPLLDQMVTRNIPNRFTTSQALEFLQSFASKMTPEELDASSPYTVDRMLFEEYDRWNGLPEEFIKKWGHFREPKATYRIKVLRRICNYGSGRTLVRSVRRVVKLWRIMSSKVAMRSGEIAFSSRLGMQQCSKS